MNNKEIENNFTYHAPKEDMIQKFQILRNKAKEFGLLINELVPAGREQSLAQTKLQEVVMWLMQELLYQNNSNIFIKY